MWSWSLAQILVLLVVLLAAALVPSFTQRTLVFGVRVPPNRLGHPALQRARRGYYIGLVGIAVLAIAAEAMVDSHLFNDLGIADPVILMAALLAEFVDYYLCHRYVRKVKQEDDWYAGQRQVVIADTAWMSGDRGKGGVWLVWALPSLVILAATAVLGIIEFPRIPEVFPVHFDLQGQPNGWAHKSVLSVFLPVVLQLMVTLIIGSLTALAVRAPLRIDASEPNESARREWLMARRIIQGVWLLCACINAVLLWINAVIWTQAGRLGTEVMMAVNVIVPVVVVAMLFWLYITARTTRESGGRHADFSSSQLQATGPQGTGAVDTSSGHPGRLVPRDDDRYWIAGVFYFNRDDPSVLVPKRFGAGWTFNMARPLAWVFLLGILALPALIVVVGVVASN
jgi:uncharacterized membrane protein